MKKLAELLFSPRGAGEPNPNRREALQSEIVAMGRTLARLGNARMNARLELNGAIKLAARPQAAAYGGRNDMGSLTLKQEEAGFATLPLDPLIEARLAYEQANSDYCDVFRELEAKRRELDRLEAEISNLSELLRCLPDLEAAA
ncbi:MAG TPA: hypothetical protein VE961_13790 [Pyrinomonadaceae bacterium]|nr:hypothetical protein [Pyrinomonadaceae bacterium]